MGCDIHCYIEQKREDGWHQLGLYIKDPNSGEMKEADFYVGRDYILFGLLAGVRYNASPIAYTRGVPKDMSKELAAKYEEGSEWYHDATWYDYRELTAYLGGRRTERILIDNMTKVLEDYEDEKNDDLLEAVREVKSEIDSLESFVVAISDLLEKYQVYFPEPGQIRVIMWFDS